MSCFFARELGRSLLLSLVRSATSRLIAKSSGQSLHTLHIPLDLQRVDARSNDKENLVDSPLFVVNGVAFSGSAVTPSKPVVNQGVSAASVRVLAWVNLEHQLR